MSTPMSMPLAQFVSLIVRKSSPKLFYILRERQVHLQSAKANTSTRLEKWAQKRLMRMLCDKQKTSLDVGAHMGDYALEIMPFSGRLVLFEPIAELAVKLRDLGAGAPCACSVEEVALSDHDGSAILKLPKGHKGSSSLEKENTHVADLASRVGIEERSIQTRRLDSYNYNDIEFIKIDVEGHQLSLIEGATETLDRCKPHLFMEIDNTHIPNAITTVSSKLNLLGYRGYYLISSVLFPIENFREDLFHSAENWKTGRLRINDFFFFHKDRLQEVKDRCLSFTFNES
ncbi:MAG: FkbM family methyltransferase [Myxococcales bacterium]|nr:MAG: FkbM family methyltransferase [Myxococcales bacterium]